MKATLILNDRHEIDENSFVDLRVWKVPSPVPGSAHGYKYALSYVVGGSCVLRYDNERGKGDHKHEGGVEETCAFTTFDALAEDFLADVARLRGKS
jgi:hypothetical protein